MKSVNKVSLSTSIENESLEFEFLLNGRVCVRIETYNGAKDMFESKVCDISKEEWDQFKEFLSDDDTAKTQRKCSNCGELGHNARSCLKRPDPA